MSEIDIHKYFHFMQDDYGTVYGIQEIGDVRELIKDIRQQNEQLKRLQAENERLKATHLQLQNSELKQHLEKVNCEREKSKLRKENEELKKRQITKNGFICDCEQNVKYRQALEEIKKTTEQDRNCMTSELSCCQCCDKLDLIKEIISEVLE